MRSLTGAVGHWTSLCIGDVVQVGPNHGDNAVVFSIAAHMGIQPRQQGMTLVPVLYRIGLLTVGILERKWVLLSRPPQLRDGITSYLLLFLFAVRVCCSLRFSTIWYAPSCTAVAPTSIIKVIDNVWKHVVPQEILRHLQQYDDYLAKYIIFLFATYLVCSLFLNGSL